MSRVLGGQGYHVHYSRQKTRNRLFVRFVPNSAVMMTVAILASIGVVILVVVVEAVVVVVVAAIEVVVVVVVVMVVVYFAKVLST